MTGLSHIDDKGNAHMVDVSEKDVTSRTAVAKGSVWMLPETLAMIREGLAKKGDVIGTARIAGIMAAKKTHDLIPLCHPLALSKVTVDIDEAEGENRIDVTATVKVTGQTGVEMEALTAASVAALTVYDMAKAVDRGMEIGPTRVLSKSGGKSGDWSVEPNGAKSK